MSDSVESSPVFSRVMPLVFPGALVVLGFLLGYGWSTGSPVEFYGQGMAAANRVMNQLTVVVVTSIALVIPLTANLYSSKLVKLFFSHPTIVIGLSVLIFGQAAILTTLLMGIEHPLYGIGAFVSAFITYACLVFILPFLFHIGQFLRPEYFMPVLSQRCNEHIDTWENKSGTPVPEDDSDAVFGTVDVIANIALTGMRRGDKQLVLLSIRTLHGLLRHFIRMGAGIEETRSRMNPHFIAGLVREAREFLFEKGIWPEAYLLGQILEIMEQTDRSQHQVMAELAQLLAQSNLEAVENQREDLVELHILVFNSLMRMSLDERDLRKFQNLSYHYRLLVEQLVWLPHRMGEVVKHLVHYGRLAQREGMPVALETVIYDIGEMVYGLAGQEDHIATEFVEQHASPVWFKALSEGGRVEKVALRAIIRVYWESRAKDNYHLAEMIKDLFLHDRQKHIAQIETMLEQNRPLHWEFNDRLLRMAYLSPEAERLAWEYVSEAH